MSMEEAAMTKCGDIMTPNPVCCEPTATIDVVAKTMRDKDVGPIPIVDSKDEMHLVGIVTDRDVVVKVLGAGKDVKTTAVDEVMTPAPIKCRPEDDVKKAIKLMEGARVRRIPIVDDKDKLVGIIAQADIAIRLNKTKKTGEILEEISKPPGF